MTASGEAAEHRIDRDALRALTVRLLEAHGTTRANAHVVVDHLLEADSMGLRSHGIIRIPQYIDEIRKGEIDPVAQPVIEARRPGWLVADGHRAFGQVAGTGMVDALVPRARDLGVAIAVGRRMGHTGRVGAYPERLARSGLLAIVGCSGAPSGHWVAPFGGRDGRIATNPLAIAWPVSSGDPVVADFSTAATAEGVVRSLRNRGLAVPEGMLRDAEGRPTTNPGTLYADPRGAIQPFGGALGYRGTALGLLVEVLSTLLAGDAVDDVHRVGSNLTLIAIDPDAGFADLAAGLGEHVRSSRPIDPAHEVLMPGDRERAMARATSAIAVDGPTWTALVEAAHEIGVEPPLVDG
ncbi:MAG: Ldh family oxidoreductase [Candidatus Limnocylindrales bacterium]